MEAVKLGHDDAGLSMIMERVGDDIFVREAPRTMKVSLPLVMNPTVGTDAYGRIECDGSDLVFVARNGRFRYRIERFDATSSCLVCTLRSWERS